jgi:putative peptidoglycan lipid II flippase
MRHTALFRSTAVVSAAAAASRVLGFMRDVMLAALLGAGPAADAFVVAFRIPSLFRRILGEGALNAGFVPVAQRLRDEEGAEAARRFAGEALAVAGLGLVAVAAVFEIAAGLLVLALASGYAQDPVRLDLATTYTRLMLPLLPATVLAALASALLNAQGRVTAAALAPVIVNLVLVVVLGALATSVLPAERLGAVVAGAVSLAGLVQLAALVPAVLRLPEPPVLARPRLSAAVRRMLTLGLPGLAVLAASQLAIVAATQAASASPAAVAHLYYADRLFQLPLGFVASAAGVVLLPLLVRLEREGKSDEAQAAQNEALALAVLLALPAAAGLWVLSAPIASVLFERGAFGVGDARETGRALAALATGLPAAGLTRVLSQAWFARESLRWPLTSALAGVAVAYGTAVALAPGFGVAGVAAGVSVGAWLHAIALGWGSLNAGLWRPDRRLMLRAGAGLAGALAMGASVGVLADHFATWLAPQAMLVVRAIALGGLCAAGVAAYMGAAYALGAFTLAELAGRGSAAGPR